MNNDNPVETSIAYTGLNCRTRHGQRDRVERHASYEAFFSYNIIPTISINST